MESYIHCALILVFGPFAPMQLIIWDIKAMQVESEGRIIQFLIHLVIMVWFYGIIMPDLLVLFAKNIRAECGVLLANNIRAECGNRCLLLSCFLSLVIIIIGLTLDIIAETWENITQDPTSLQNLRLRIRSFAQPHIKKWSLCHLALVLINFGYESTFSKVLTVYTIYDNYMAQTVEDYCEGMIEKYFKIPDGLEPGFEYEIHNIEISGFSILQLTIETQFDVDFGHEARFNITLLNGRGGIVGEWMQRPSALAG